VAALSARGHEVVVIDPEGHVFDFDDAAWLDGLDLVVARGRSAAVLALLEWAERRGVATVNRRAAIDAVHDKAAMAAALVAAGVRMPATFLGAPAELSARLSDDAYPLILKPTFGDNCSGLRLVHGPEELRALCWPEPVALAQSYLPAGGIDLKLYGIGREIWAVRRPSPFMAGGTSEASGIGTAGQLLQVTPQLRRLGRRCGQVLGLELFGVDCVETPAGPVVIEVNDFPNYIGVPAADARLAAHIGARRPAEVQR
jgi:ribosomal protein S6--L-glutamate ligase